MRSSRCAGLYAAATRMLRQPSDIRPRRLFLRLELSTGTRTHGPFIAAICLLLLLVAGPAIAQSAPSLCTTQSAMTADMRQSLADTALAIATAVNAGDSARVQSMSAADIAANFNSTGFLIHQTATAIANDTLRVTQLYRLDASGRKAGETTAADFGCALSGTNDEVDFAIPGLPPGVYAFAIVEAVGDRPWLLPILLQQEGNTWKMAGFYPHTRTVAGHDGLWYWTAARGHAKAGRKWLAWVLYGEADQLLRPANFVTSTHLDQLRSERRSSAPGELSEGISTDTPLVIKAKDGTEFHFTSVSSAATDDGKSLNLVLHYHVDSMGDPAAANAHNTAAASTMLAAHPELREGFSGVSIFAEAQGQSPFITEQNLAEIH